MRILNDLEKNGEKSKYNNSKLNSLLSKYQQVKKTNNILQPLETTNQRQFMRKSNVDSLDLV